MPILNVIVLSLIQGVTEFLPISSSAHLILVPFFTSWEDQGLLMDVAMHVGTLFAVLLYFRNDIAQVIKEAFNNKGNSEAKNEKNIGNKNLLFYIVIATIPVLVFGLFVSKYVGDAMRGIEIIGWTSILYGVLLFVVDKRSSKDKEIADISLKDAVVLGFAQALALVPGTSRSGITMTAARAMGVNRKDAAKFSMFMAVPTIMAAGAYEGLKLYKLGDFALTQDALIACVLSFVSAFAVVHLLMKWLEKFSFAPFVFYRVILGIGLLYFAYAK
ncbi:MAG: undecaprenyl-diphosphate phosphatase [Alphaproteobacteria bacterium]|nr:undecaprenyl-diphosphate phosphatase [Alphaproteobacteria bacterium]